MSKQVGLSRTNPESSWGPQREVKPTALKRDHGCERPGRVHAKGLVKCELDFVVEAFVSLLVQPNNPGTTPFGEWWADPILATQATNAIMPFTLSTSTLVLSTRLLATSSKGSLFTVPGTVIQLNIQENGTALQESVSRPVVALHPRTGYTGPSQVITATVSSDFPIQQAAFIVNGVVKPVDLGDPSALPYAGPYQMTFSATAQELGVSSGSLVVATALEFSWQSGWALPGGAGPLPSVHVPGVNECRF